jgi:hypothetical protein
VPCEPPEKCQPNVEGPLLGLGAQAKGMGPVLFDTNGAPSSPDHLRLKYDSYYFTCDLCASVSCHTDPSTGKEHCS